MNEIATVGNILTDTVQEYPRETLIATLVVVGISAILALAKNN